MGLVLLLSLCSLCVSESAAMDIAILQSSDIAAYREAIAGLEATGPIGAIYTEYDAQGDLELGETARAQTAGIEMRHWSSPWDSRPRWRQKQKLWISRSSI